MFIGTAAWSVPKIEAENFPLEGTHLERYAQVLNAVEINSSFYNDHTPTSYSKWAHMTPDHFRFSVKLNQRFTHECDLQIGAIDLKINLEGIAHLEEKWGALLLQYPGKQKFHAGHMEKIYKIIRKVFKGMIALEARNVTWLEADAIELMNTYNINKVIADPEKCPGVQVGKEKYYRLHGSPEIYRSNYSEEYLESLFQEIKKEKNAWCIFDNTTFGHATSNALTLKNKGDEYERRTRLHGDSTSHMHTFDEYREH